MPTSPSQQRAALTSGTLWPVRRVVGPDTAQSVDDGHGRQNGLDQKVA